MRYATGDLLEFLKNEQVDFIAHGCNCFNTMKAGIAKQIAEVYPFALEADEATKKGDHNKLGTYSIGMTDDDDECIIIINAYTQYHYGSPKEGNVLCDYDAVEKVFTELNRVYGGLGLTLGIPKIGAGLAGGHWGTIERIIDSVTPDLDILCVQYQK